LAAHTGISKSTMARYFTLFGLQPHRNKSFKLSMTRSSWRKSAMWSAVPQSAGQGCVDESHIY